MEDKKLLQDLKRHRPKLRRGKSDLYRWLEENLQRLTAEGYGTPDGPEWQELTDRLNRIGKVNKDGQPLGNWGLISIFKRVKRDVEARQREARTGSAIPKQQTRMAKGWTPPVVAKAAPAATQSSPFAPTTSSTDLGTSDQYSPERLKAGFLETVAKRSGR